MVIIGGGQMTEIKKPNPFIENIKKNIGREITVVVGTPKGEKKLTGVCEAVDFIHKNVILRDDKNTYMVRNYLYIIRPRPKRDDGKGKKVSKQEKK